MIFESVIVSITFREGYILRVGVGSLPVGICVSILVNVHTLIGVYTLETMGLELAEKIRNGNFSKSEKDRVHKTFNLHISEYALIEQVKQKFHFKDYSQTLLYCVWNAAIEEGIES